MKAISCALYFDLMLDINMCYVLMGVRLEEKLYLNHIANKSTVGKFLVEMESIMLLTT